MKTRILATVVSMAVVMAAGTMLAAGCGGRGTEAATRPAVSGPAESSGTGSSATPVPAATGSGSGEAVTPLTGTAPAQSFPVAVRRDTFTRDGTRTLRTTTWYPKRSGTFPLVLFSHGLTGDPEDFTPLLSRWASAGFLVVAPAYPKTSRDASTFDVTDVLNQPADASFVLTQTLSGPLRDSIDPTRIGAAGHSAGGITTVGLFTSARDQRLRAGVVFAGSAIGVGSTFRGSAAPLLFVHGEADPVVSYASGKAVYDAVAWPKALLTLPGQDHAGPYLRESNSAYAEVTACTTDFLRYSLYGDVAARGRLAADSRPDGVLDNRL